MEKPAENKIQPVVLPKGEFADEDDCCYDCAHAIDHKSAFFGSKVLCEIDRKWHSSNHCCSHYRYEND